jgi:cysteine synthase
LLLASKKEKLQHQAIFWIRGLEISLVSSQTLTGEAIRLGPHKTQGIGAGYVARNLKLEILEKVLTVTNEGTHQVARRLAKEERILAWIFAGAMSTLPRDHRAIGGSRESDSHGDREHRGALS